MSKRKISVVKMIEIRVTHEDTNNGFMHPEVFRFKTAAGAAKAFAWNYVALKSKRPIRICVQEKAYRRSLPIFERMLKNG